MPDTPDILVTDDERRLGFSAQTLAYADGEYELAGLRAEAQRRLERTVALSLDGGARIRRRHHGDGYVLETLDGETWRVTAEFASLHAVAECEAYRRAVPREEAGDADPEPE